MNFFVAMTKESHLCHVIIASSNGYLLREIFWAAKLDKTSQFMKLDYLKKEDVVTWLRNIKRYNKIEDYTLDEQQIETIWETVGGSTWEIYYILEKLFQYPLETIVAKIKRERVAMIADWCFRDPEGHQRRALLRKFVDTPVLETQSFDPGHRDTLGQAVKDNILSYDPVDGTYGVQGKSLEWGIKRYFEEP